MTKNNFYSAFLRLRVIATAILTLTLVTFPARSNQPVNAQTPVQKTPSPVREAKGGPKEGIKVHGHWTIEVRNPDGKLVTRREFENSLTSYGAYLLVLFLGRDSSPGPWAMQLIGNACNAGEARFGTNCVIGEARSVHSDFQTLTFSVDAPGTNPSGPVPANITFRATATAHQDGTITGVGMFSEGQCARHISPEACYNTTPPQYGNYAPLTSTTLVDSAGQAAPLNVAAGRIIQVTMVITFS